MSHWVLTIYGSTDNEPLLTQSLERYTQELHDIGHTLHTTTLMVGGKEYSVAPHISLTKVGEDTRDLVGAVGQLKGVRESAAAANALQVEEHITSTLTTNCGTKLTMTDGVVTGIDTANQSSTNTALVDYHNY
jgi:hypothetical protein